MRFELRQTGDWSYYCAPELEAKGVIHGFFTKLAPHHALTGNEKGRFLDTFSLKDIVIMAQEHGDRVHVVSDGERPRMGDGIIILERGVAGVIKTADCLPVILVEPDLPAAAVVHAGWRGTVKRIVKKAVDKIVGLGGERTKIMALLGPAIGPCCYEVKEDVYGVFRDEGFSPRVIRNGKGAVFLDIKKANIETLTGEGIERIYDAGLCTKCSNGIFHSFRAGERERRQINFVSFR